MPTARAAGVASLEIVVDSNERYPYRFGDRDVTVMRGRLAAGDYGVMLDGQLVVSVERKSLPDLVSSLTTGKLKYQLADLAALPRAAVVVEDRYSSVFRLDRVRPAVVADGLAECQVTWPSVPLVFCETRKLAQEWVYRFLAAAHRAAEVDAGGQQAVDALVGAPGLAPPPSTLAEIRGWARANGYTVSDRGRVSRKVLAAFDEATRGR